MKHVYPILFVSIVLCIASAVDLFAACKYVDKDEVGVDKNGYIMRWLMLDPYIPTGVGSTVAVGKDYLKDCCGGEAKIAPKEGDKVKIDGKEYTWVKINLADLAAMKEIPAAVGGNELDIGCWGGQGVNNAAEYLVTYLKWKKGGPVTFGLGSDDASELYLNGNKLIDCPKDQNWGAENCGSKTANVKANEVNTLVVGVYESGGEWGFSVKVNPVPDTVGIVAVEPAGKLAATWGAVKRGD